MRTPTANELMAHGIGMLCDTIKNGAAVTAKKWDLKNLRYDDLAHVAAKLNEIREFMGLEIEVAK